MNDPEWFSSLPEQLQEAPYFKPPESGEHRTMDQVLSDLSNAAKLQGNLSESHIKVPGPDAANEDIEAFRDRVLGIDQSMIRKPEDHSPVPASADEYKDKEIEGFDVDLSEVKALAVESKWTQAQYDGFVDQMAADHKAGKETQTEWFSAQKTAIRDALGDAAGDHIARTVGAIEDASPELAEGIKNGTIDANVVLAIDTLVHKIIDMGGEEGEFNSQAGAGSRVPTPEEAVSKLNEIRTQLSEMRQSDPQYAILTSKMLEYQGLARPRT